MEFPGHLCVLACASRPIQCPLMKRREIPPSDSSMSVSSRLQPQSWPGRGRTSEPISSPRCPCLNAHSDRDPICPVLPHTLPFSETVSSEPSVPSSSGILEAEPKVRLETSSRIDMAQLTVGAWFGRSRAGQEPSCPSTYARRGRQRLVLTYGGVLRFSVDQRGINKGTGYKTD